MKIIKINEHISYIECSDDPLSADVGIVTTEKGMWLFDAGNNPGVCECLTRFENAQAGGDANNAYNVVISHFHKDHMGNIDKINAKDIYLSKFSYDHAKKGIIVSDDIYIDNLHIFILPSSHAKGCVCLEVDEEYAFVGDALYSKSDKTHYIYNAQLLKEEIDILKSINSHKLLVSHYPGLVRKKEEVIAELEEIYSHREKDSSEIRIPH